MWCGWRLNFAYEFLQELYNPVPSKREPKLEATGPCKRETVLQGEVLDILDSEEEQEAAAPIVKRPKAECHSPVRAHATSAGEALVVLTDDEHDEIMGSNDSNVSPVPLQAAAAEPHHKPTAPVLKVRDHWRELLLSGAKTWELRTFSCEANQGRMALGYAGHVDGFVTFVEFKVVSVRVGNGYTGKPSKEQDFPCSGSIL